MGHTYTLKIDTFVIWTKYSFGGHLGFGALDKKGLYNFFSFLAKIVL